MCAGCGQRDAADALLRVVLGPADETGATLAVDAAGGKFGRGAHVHPVAVCVAKAARGGFARVFKTKIATGAEALGEAIVVASHRRIEGLVIGARRGGLLAIGADAVAQALEDARADVVLVASDAAAACRVPGIERAIDGGRALVVGDKKRLGALLGRDEVAVCAVLHPGVAASVVRAYRAHQAFGSFSASRSGAWWSPEVR